MEDKFKKHDSLRLMLKLFTSLSLLVTFILLVAPKKDTPLLTIVPLLLVWFVFYYSAQLIMSALLTGLKRVRQLVAIGSSSLVTLLVMFSALGQLAFFDVILFLSLTVLAVFYIKRTWSK